jgi:nucleotide-binding universal stress UspA family protein
MINNILVPTDFSKPALNALHYALGLCKKANAALHIIHINHVALVDASMPAETYQLFVNEIEESAKENFEKLENEVLKASGVNYKTHTRYGFVGDEICRFAEEHNMDLVVMGTTGASGLAEILIGSNAATVVSKSQVPVLVVPPNTPFKDLNKIVYATDYNEPEFPAVTRLIYYAELFDCELHIIHVKTDYDRYFNSENNFFKKNKANITYPKLIFKDLPEGDVLSTINNYVNANNADLLVMAKHNRNFFDRLFHRSLSKKMAYHTTLPLLILFKD